MRIRAAHALVLLLHSGLAVATVGCLVVMQRAIEAEQRLMRQRFDATAALQGFRDGNQLLAGSAQAAATTGNRNQTELYWRELLVARRRERAATELRRLGLIPRERVIWREAHSASDALVRQQQQALVLAERGDRNRAVALLLNPATLQRQQGVRFLSESLQRRLNERFGFDLAEVQQRQRQLWQWMVLLVLLDLLLVFSVLVLFTPRFITQPLVLLNQQLRRRLAGQPAARPPLAGAAAEIQDLAASLEAQETLEQSFAQARWLATEQARISEALQRAATAADTGASLLRDLGRALELGGGALYGLDRATGLLHPLAGYAVESLPASIRPGEGLLGECFSQAQPLELAVPPVGYLPVRSGLGQSAPAALWLLPVLSGEQVLAVLELALLKPLQPPQRQLVLNVLPLLALALERLAGAHAQPRVQ